MLKCLPFWWNNVFYNVFRNLLGADRDNIPAEYLETGCVLSFNPQGGVLDLQSDILITFECKVALDKLLQSSLRLVWLCAFHPTHSIAKNGEKNTILQQIPGRLWLHHLNKLFKINSNNSLYFVHSESRLLSLAHPLVAAKRCWSVYRMQFEQQRKLNLGAISCEKHLCEECRVFCFL